MPLPTLISNLQTFFTDSFNLEILNSELKKQSFLYPINIVAENEAFPCEQHVIGIWCPLPGAREGQRIADNHGHIQRIYT